MVVDGTCHKCKAWFSAHWHDYNLFMKPNACPYCKSLDVSITNDEDNQEGEDKIYEDEEEL